MVEISEVEYRELLESKSNNSKEWNLIIFLRGFLTKWGIKFLVWITSTVFVYLLLVLHSAIIPTSVKILITIGWIIISVLYFLSVVPGVDRAMASAIAQMKITAELKAIASLSKDYKYTGGDNK